MKQNKIRIAVQKSGKLYDESMTLLKSIGVNCSKIDPRELITQCDNNEVEILNVRHGDIPCYVENGVADFGIVGSNVLEEREFNIKVVKKLGFGQCTLVIAVPEDSPITSTKKLEGERIATSYPSSLKKFLKKKDVNASITQISGSVEIAPQLDLSDAIYDIVQTGKSLKDNNLKPLTTVYSAEAVFIANTSIAEDKCKIIAKLL